MQPGYLLRSLYYTAALIDPASISATTVQARDSVKLAPQASIGNAEAQKKYDIAIAAAKAKRDFDIAVATAEAQRKFEILQAEAQAPRSPDPSASAVTAPPPEPISMAPRDELPSSSPYGANQARLSEIGASRCDAGITSAEAIARDPNRYASECLEFDEWRDYSVTGLNGTLSIGTGNDVAEVLGSYSIYKRQPRGTAADRFSFSRWQIRGGPLVPLDKSGGTTAAFADLTEAQPFRRAGGLLGFEWRSGQDATSADLTKAAQKMLVKAQQDCEDYQKEMLLIVSEGGRRELEDTTACIGKKLQKTFMADSARRNTYWDMIADDLWGKKPKSEFFIGIEGRYLPYRQKYLPLRDTALTGDVLLTSPPFDAGGSIPDANMREFSKPRYSAKLYGGGTEGNFGWGGSLSYRRVVDQPKGTNDVTLCPPSAPIAAVCTTAKISRPYDSEGWVVGGRLAGKLPRFAFLPEAGVELRVSYAADLQQVAFDAPLHFLVDKDGKAMGGLRFGCTGDGETERGYVVKGECKASVFIGTSFVVRGSP